MSDALSTSAQEWLGLGVVALGGLLVFASLIRNLGRNGGRVQSGKFDLPELLMTLVFAGFFGFETVAAFLRYGTHEPVVNIDIVLPNSILFIIFVAGIVAFLQFRGLDVRDVFGLRRLPLLALILWTLGLFAAALPLASAAHALTGLAAAHQQERQPLVELFQKVAAARDYRSVAKVTLAAAVIQPVCEEIIFRGFFYGVWKRYLGPVWAGTAACLLFGAFHTSVDALAGLVILAACLNLAYERTGCLLVPIGMHALFNATSLLLMLAQARAPHAS